MSEPWTSGIRLGGMRKTREVCQEDPFERDVSLLFRDRLLADNTFGHDLWSAMSNIDWRHPEHGNVGPSFRYAGDLIAAILQDPQEMAYMRWYCASETGVVSAEIRDAMASKGWQTSRFAETQ